MEQLIKISDYNGKKAVSARELYSKLSGENNLLSNVNSWMQRNIENNIFAIQNQDYQIIRYSNESGRQMIDYALSIEFSKELCMMSQCDKGKQIRLYFIECEKQLFKPKELTKKELALMIIESENDRELAESKIKELEPKAMIYDKISDCTNLKPVGEVAKELGTGEHRLFNFLRQQSIIMPDRNIPYQKWIERGYFTVKTKPINNTDKNYSQTYFTPKGEVWIADVYLRCTNQIKVII